MLLIFACGMHSVSAQSHRRPNVVFILADDLGWSDTTLFGTTELYRTPNIQRLAQRGMTFSRAYASSPLCSPTRASVLTGLSPARIGITSPTCHLPKVVLQASETPSAAPNQKATIPVSATRFDTKYYTMAEMFKDNGYATGHFGKWHLGPEPFSPLEHGFDVDLPHTAGPGPAGSYVAPWKFKDFDHDPRVPDEHIEDRMAKEAAAFMEHHKTEPFFLNYWMFSVHAPFDAKQELINQYQQKVNPNAPQRSPTYAAMIHSMDDAVGTLLNTLDRLKLSNDTIIVFASDNGGNMYNEVDGTSATSNTPLRGGKATMYEGGVRGPAIVAYPGKIPQASTSDQIIQSSDFYPTLLDLLSIEPQSGQAFDGVSIAPAFHGQPLSRDAIFTYFPHKPVIPEWLPPAVSVHQGDWKLIRIFFGGENGQHRYKLFNLANDIGEQDNLAASQIDRVNQLDGLIEQFLIDTNAVRPLMNPRFDPTKYDPEREGKAELKGSKNAPKSKPRAKSKLVAGWRPQGTCEIVTNDGALIITSNGGDPHCSYNLPAPISTDSIKLSFTMVSEAAGDGQVFWQEQGVRPGFHKDRSIGFAVRHDGKPHEYSVAISASKPIVAVRLDPSSSKGRSQVLSMKLSTADGRDVYKWKF